MARKTAGEGRRSLRRFLRFNLVGAASSVIDFGIYWLLNRRFGWTYTAQTISFCCGMVNSYYLNSRWTFRERWVGSAGEGLRFALVNLTALGVSLLCIWFLQNVAGLTNAWAAGWMPGFLSRTVNGDALAKLSAMFCSMLVNYFGNQHFVYREPVPGAA